MYGRTGQTGTKRFKHVQQSSVIIGNFQKDILTLTEQSTLTFESKRGQKEQSGICFMIDTYDDLGDHKNGSLVAISCGIDRKKFILCVENNSIILKEGQLPEEILSENAEFIFYGKDFGSEDIMTFSNFESSVKRGLFLACSEDGRNLSIKKYAKDEVDKMTFSLGAGQSVIRYKPIVALGARRPYRIRNSYDYYLIARPEESIANFVSDGEARGEQALFYMNSYRDTTYRHGVPVIFSCKVRNKNYLLCIANNSVIIKESELPNDIPTDTSEYIFYIKEFATGHETYLFESSLKPEQRICLAWNKEDTRKTLVVKEYQEGCINESMNFYVEN